MANLPNFNLPADLPVNWQPDQIVSPDGVSVGLTAQHGYNTLSQYINNAQTALNQLREFLASAGYVDTAALNTALGRYLPLAGGTMSGILDMNGKRITSVGTPSASTDAANKAYVDSQRNTRLALSGGTMSGSINHGGYRAINLGAPSAASDGATKGYVDVALSSFLKIETGSYFGNGSDRSLTLSFNGHPRILIIYDQESSYLWDDFLMTFYPDAFSEYGSSDGSSSRAAIQRSSRYTVDWGNGFVAISNLSDRSFNRPGATYNYFIMGVPN